MAGRDAVDDAVPLTPIQHWFMETPMRDRNRWCLSAVFALPFLPPLERLRAVAHALQQRPDALRMRWVAGLTGMAQQSGQTQEPIVRIVPGAARKRVAEGKSRACRGELGGGRRHQKKNNRNQWL